MCDLTNILFWLKWKLINQELPNNNYSSSPDELQQLTAKFRSQLEIWRDEKNETKLVEIDGEEKHILSAPLKQLLEYLTEYSEKWIQTSRQQKLDFKKIGTWIVGDCISLEQQLI